MSQRAHPGFTGLPGGSGLNGNLDLLRAAAVLAVVTVHCMRDTPVTLAVGRFAVLVFFVHTALVLLLSLERQSGSPHFTSRFYLQRLCRIYPLAIVCLAVTVGLHLPLTDIPRSSWSVPLHFALMQNFLGESLGILPPMWSLPYEVQMYLLLPLVFLIVRQGGWWRVPLLVLVSIEIPARELRYAPFGEGVISQFFPCFIAGAVAYRLYRIKPRVPWWLFPALVVILAAIFCWTGATRRGQWASCLVLGLAIPCFNQIPVAGIRRLCGLIVRYSYGIYLSHYIVIWLCFKGIPGLSTPLRWLCFAVLAGALPIPLYHLIELPMINLGKKLSRGVAPQHRHAFTPPAGARAA